MSQKRSHDDYWKKAAMYDFLGQFYKYSNPNLHMDYYWKHLKYLRKANESIRKDQPAGTKDAAIRFLHTSFNAPNMDVYINGNRLVKDLPYKQVSLYLTLKPGKYHIDLYPTGNMTDSVLNKKVTIEAGKSYTLAAIDSVKKMRLLSYENQPVVPWNESKVRFIHLSPDAGPMDIAVKNRDVVFPNIVYKQATDYLGLTPMTVDLETRQAGTRNVFLPMPHVQFNPNETYTIVITGLNKDKPELQAVVIKE